jgi:dipeptide transport system ATP-binding protein
VSLLSARHLTRYYRVRHGLGQRVIRALEDVSFDLDSGKSLAVVGESGCGKSTLARQLTLVEKPSGGALYLDRVELTGASPAQLRAARPMVQMVFQNPHTSLNPRKRIEAILEEPLLINTTLGKSRRRERVRAMLAAVGLPAESALRYPHMFSGGQRQRIAIARALILNPKVVVADEPLAALDISIQAQILNLFMDLQDELGLSYVFISHNLRVVRHITHHAMVLYLGRVAELGEKSRIFEVPLHPYTRALLASTPTIQTRPGKPIAAAKGEPPSPFNPPHGCAFHTRCPYAVDRCRAERPALRELDGRLVACHRVEEITPA